MMDQKELKAYLDAQLEEIQKFKWIESERASHDIGFHSAAFEWIDRYSADFREYWNGNHSKHLDKKTAK